ncbi:Acetyltransferase (GNAT) domain-containing protein OS=Bosea thiooxidans OX=53254 GN=ARD30_12070 PE=4 SV=1 [Bosea thiooxidans]
MIIRRAVAADIAPAASLMAQAYATHFRPIIGDAALGFDQAHFAARFLRELTELTVLDADGVRGVLLVKDGHIAMLFAAETGQGHGAALLAHAEAHGAHSLEVFADNDGARRFYERAGWQVTRDYQREFAGAQHRFLRYEKPMTRQQHTSPHPEEARRAVSKDAPVRAGASFETRSAIAPQDEGSRRSKETR